MAGQLLALSFCVVVLVVVGGKQGRRSLKSTARRSATRRLKAGVRPAGARRAPAGTARAGQTVTSGTGVTHRVLSGQTTVCGVKVVRTKPGMGRRCRRCF